MNYLAPEGPVYQAGTLSGNPLAMAAGKALLELLIANNPYSKLETNSKTLLNGIKKIMKTKDIEFSSSQIGGMFGFFFAKTLPKNFSDVVGSNDSNFIKFINLCIGKGIYFAPSKFEAGFISSKHTKKDIELTLEKIQTIIKKDF